MRKLQTRLTVALLFTVGIAAVKSYAALGAAAALLASSSITALIRIGIFAHVPESPPDARHLMIEPGE